MSNTQQTKNARTGKRGAFINGIWHCDCEPRLPAEKFQTKNGGKNHGRWFFTCQKPQPKRCSFFLWSDDAKVREESALISNSRSEPQIAPVEPKTPKKQTKLTEPPTPLTRPRSVTLSAEAPQKMTLWAAAEVNDAREEIFDWSSSGDEELTSVAQASMGNEEDTPRKTARTSMQTSPSKRKHTDTSVSNEQDINRQPNSDMLTPRLLSRTTGLPSPLDTNSRPQHHQATPDLPSSLATEVLEVLKNSNLPAQIEKDLVEILNRHDLRTQGIMRGRDITRLAVQAKDKKIAELQARITELEIEKETSRTVIAHLKQDIATSPKRHARPRPSSRSEI